MFWSWNLSWFHKRRKVKHRPKRKPCWRKSTFLQLEELESRWVPADHLVLITQPSAVGLQAPFALDVAVDNASNSLDTTYSGTVAVSLASYPGGAVLGGTTS